jgi:hypothetical protein
MADSNLIFQTDEVSNIADDHDFFQKEEEVERTKTESFQKSKSISLGKEYYWLLLFEQLDFY